MPEDTIEKITNDLLCSHFVTPRIVEESRQRIRAICRKAVMMALDKFGSDGDEFELTKEQKEKEADLIISQLCYANHRIYRPRPS